MKRFVAVVTIVSLFFTLVLPLDVWAGKTVHGKQQTSTTDGNCKNGRCPPDDPCAHGSEVGCYTGGESLEYQDFFLQGLGLDLEIKRSYNGASDYNGAFGYGWDLSVNKGFEKYGNNQTRTYTYVVREGMGSSKMFVETSTNMIVGPPGDSDVLYKDYQENKYKLKKPDGTILVFNRTPYPGFGDQGDVERIIDRNGNRMTFAYTEDYQDIMGISEVWPYLGKMTVKREYQLLSITDTQGRVVTFNYNEDRRLASISYD